MTSVRNWKKGFSLAEALLAIFLLASIIVYSISAFIVARHASKLSRERIIVSNLLRGYMEDYLSVNYSDIPPEESESTPIVLSEPNISIRIDDSRTFSANKRLEFSRMEPGIYGYKKIYGKIAWSGGLSGNKPLEEEMVIYVTKR